MPEIASIGNKKTQIQGDNFEWRTEGSGQGDGVIVTVQEGYFSQPHTADCSVLCQGIRVNAQ